MSSDTGRLTLTGVAERAEVRLSAVSNWRARYADFPRPQVAAGQELFDIAEVAQWLRRRRIPQNRLKPDEPPGTSYGDRFLRNVARTVPGAASGVQRSANWEPRLWAAMATMRGAHDVASSLEFLLGLVYVRTQRTDVWRSVVNKSTWPEMLDLLSSVSFSEEWGGQPIAVFPALTRMGDQSLLEAVRVMDTIDFGDGDSPESTGALLGEAILANLERGMGRGGGHFTPPDVARCLVELLDPRLTDNLYDPFCGSGELLSTAAAHVNRVDGTLRGWQVCGQTPQPWSWLTSKMNLALHGVEAELATPANALDDDRFPEQRFSRILANPPFNLNRYLSLERKWLFGVPPPQNANFAWLQHIVSKLAVDGRAAVIMPNGASSTKDPAEARIRERMVDAGVVECVIALPPGLFRFTGIPTTLWILRGVGAEPAATETLFIDARNLGEMADRTKRILRPDDIRRIVDEYWKWRNGAADDAGFGAEGFARAVGQHEISENDYVLTPGRYVGGGVERPGWGSIAVRVDALREEIVALRKHAKALTDRIDARLAAVLAGERSRDDGAVVALGTVCDVLAGPGSVTRSGREISWTPLVLPRNIRENRIGDEDPDVVPPAIAGRLTRYRLIAGDIVTARTGTLGRYGLVSADQAGWLLGPGCVRFRPDDQADPHYLIYYLGGPDARRWLERNAAGSAIPHVNVSTWRKMPIWLPSPPVQQAIVETLKPLRTAAAVHSKISAANLDLQDLLLSMLTSPTAPVPMETAPPVTD